MVFPHQRLHRSVPELDVDDEAGRGRSRRHAHKPTLSACEPQYLSSGSGDPASLATVGNRSMLLVGSSICSPAWITPGQRRMPGTRIPPSQLLAFPPGRPNTEAAGRRVSFQSLVEGSFQYALPCPPWRGKSGRTNCSNDMESLKILRAGQHVRWWEKIRRVPYGARHMPAVPGGHELRLPPGKLNSQSKKGLQSMTTESPS